MRGRSRNKGPNPLTRSYESNGPDVKIRGTAQHIADKYSQLARDATASGDPVAAENYLQHAEHYYRLIAAAQEQFRQQYGGIQRPFDEDGEDGDDEGSASGSFGFPGDRQGGDEFGEGAFAGAGFEGREGRQPDGRDTRPFEGRQPDNRSSEGRYNGERPQGGQPRFDRNDRQFRSDRHDRGGERFDRGGPDRNGQDRNGQDRHGQDRNGYDRGPERGGYDRNGPDRNQDRGGYDRGASDRGGPDRGAPDRNGYDRGERRERFPRGEGRRDFRPDRGPHNGPQNGPEGGFRAEQGRQPRQPEEAREEVPAGLPAFLTSPVRPPITVADPTEPPVEANGSFEAASAGEGVPDLTGIRPRRRRSRRTEGDEGGASAAPDAVEPTGE